ncbi:hypothetical protein [Duganella sp. sic0402]|uniref:hypothetical protein n=1 Tax=Duganella sp. sic0402 TaxID=2854786 RepID=UPI001E2A5C45|nr:hypothetical protein [Duganella sp. sic0402]
MTDIANPVAQAQAAMHRAALLLERSRNGQSGDSPQARWHAAQQTALIAWLEAGGFTQGEPEKETAKENSGTEPLLSVPQGDLNEESKFSLSRIDDAVE